MNMTAMQAHGAGQATREVTELVTAAIAEELTDRDLDVRGPDWNGSRCLKVTNVPGTSCEILVTPDGQVEWECWPSQGRRPDPGCTAATVLAILGAGDAEPTAAAPSGRCRCAISFKGVTGRILAGHGMRVTVQVYPDQQFFEVYSDIHVASPARPERGTVRVADDGSVLWRCRARTRPGDDAALDPAEIAAIIARALAGTGQPGCAVTCQAGVAGLTGLPGR